MSTRTPEQKAADREYAKGLLRKNKNQDCPVCKVGKSVGLAVTKADR